MALVPLLAPPRSASRPRWLALVVVLLVAASIPYGWRVAQNPTKSAFLRWYPQIQELGTGTNIYLKYNYPNPPIMALILRPLVTLPPVTAALCWFYLKVAMTLLAFRWVFLLIQGKGVPFPLWAQILTIGLSIRAVEGDLSHGNVNLFILFLVVGALYAYAHRRDWLAGTALGLAIACKVTPALFVPYLIWKRAWKTLGGCAVGLVLFLLVIPAGFLGEEQNHRLLGSWVDQMVKPYVVEGKVLYSEHENQSLPGVLVRLLSHSPSFSTYNKAQQLVALRYHNLADWSPQALGWFVKGCFIGFAVLMAFSCRPTTEPRSGWRAAAECSLIVLGMLLFSERTWKHHCVTLVLPFGVLSYYLLALQPRVWLRNYLIGTLVLVALLMLATGTGLRDDAAGDWSNDPGKIAQVYGAYVWGYLLLIAAMTTILWAKEPPVRMPIVDGGEIGAATGSPRCTH